MWKPLFFALFLIIQTSLFLQAELVVDPTDPDFAAMVQKELKKMDEGERGLVCQTLVEKLNESEAQTVIKPLTRDEETWHPNDHRGIRSHVVPDDFKVRGAARTKPTKATLYLHPSRINPKISAFKLGTFAHKLAEAHDLNAGTFSGDYVEREKRFSFYRNAWRFSMGFPLTEQTGDIETLDYQLALEKGLVIEDNRELFPILHSSEPTPPLTQDHQEEVQE